MSAEEITLETLNSRTLAQSANENCIDCLDLRQLGTDVINELPAIESIDVAQVVGRFAGFAVLCKRETPIPAPKCKPGLCSVKDKARGCLLKELMNMTPEERAALVMDLSSIDNL